MANLAGVYEYLAQYAKALLLYQDALAIWRRAGAKEHPDLAACLNNLGGLHRKMGQYSKALPLFQEAVAIFRKLGKRSPLAMSLTVGQVSGL